MLHAKHESELGAALRGLWARLHALGRDQQLWPNAAAAAPPPELELLFRAQGAARAAERLAQEHELQNLSLALGLLCERCAPELRETDRAAAAKQFAHEAHAAVTSLEQQHTDEHAALAAVHVTEATQSCAALQQRLWVALESTRCDNITLEHQHMLLEQEIDNVALRAEQAATLTLTLTLNPDP